MAVTAQNVLEAAEYAYTNYLSKPYTDKSYKGDWELKAKDDAGTVINRPNHGLAHSVRGAMYAPVVCSYFKSFAKDKDKFQFTTDELHKIQIALLFRVAGRENDGGYNDNPENYKRFQKNHAEAFKQYCNDNPGIYTEAEVDKYADVLQTYAAPGQDDPLKTIFKACHNIDLLRCCTNERMEVELQPIRDQIGDYTNDLVIYADNCIRQTGTRITDNNPITKKRKTDYDRNIFTSVSQSVERCTQEIANVPTPAELYYQNSKTFKRNPTEQSQYVKHLQRAADLGHKSAAKELDESLYKKYKTIREKKQTPNISPNAIDMTNILGKPKILLSQKSLAVKEIGAINDKWQQKEKVESKIYEITNLIKNCKKVLDSEMELPNPFTISVDGKEYTGEKALTLFAKKIASMSVELNEVTKFTGSDYEKNKVAALEELSYITRAIEVHSSQSTLKLNKELNTIHLIFNNNNVNIKTKDQALAEIAKQHYLEGKGSEFEEKLHSLDDKEKEVQLEYGPLNKSIHTYRYESLMKDMMSGAEFTINHEDNQTIINFGNNESYNITEIMKYANLNHVTLSDADAQAYMDFIANDEIQFPPCKPNKENPRKPIKIKTKEDLEALDQNFLEKDPSLAELSQAERMALNVYTTGFYTPANSLLRAGKLPTKTEQIREVICTTGMAISGLNKINNEVPVNTFRGERKLPEDLLTKRIEAAEKGGVTLEQGFISTSEVKPDVNFAFQNSFGDKNIGIVFNGLIGKSVRGLSAFPNEREFLIPPTQLEWQHHVNVRGGHLFSAKPAVTPTGLEENALMGLTLEQRAKHEEKSAVNVKPNSNLIQMEEEIPVNTEQANEESKITDAAKQEKPSINTYRAGHHARSILTKSEKVLNESINTNKTFTPLGFTIGQDSNVNMYRFKKRELVSDIINVTQSLVDKIQSNEVAEKDIKEYQEYLVTKYLQNDQINTQYQSSRHQGPFIDLINQIREDTNKISELYGIGSMPEFSTVYSEESENKVDHKIKEKIPEDKQSTKQQSIDPINFKHAQDLTKSILNKSEKVLNESVNTNKAFTPVGFSMGISNNANMYRFKKRELVSEIIKVAEGLDKKVNNNQVTAMDIKEFQDNLFKAYMKNDEINQKFESSRHQGPFIDLINQVRNDANKLSELYGFQPMQDFQSRFNQESKDNPVTKTEETQALDLKKHKR